MRLHEHLADALSSPPAAEAALFASLPHAGPSGSFPLIHSHMKKRHSHNQKSPDSGIMKMEFIIVTEIC